MKMRIKLKRRWRQNESESAQMGKHLVESE